METLTVETLIPATKKFCELLMNTPATELFGVTDGKAIGTYVEHSFINFLKKNFVIKSSENSSKGLDIPSINTDIKATSSKQPQSSCPFKNSKQKIYGLGYNLLVFIYDKQDNMRTKKGCLKITNCFFIDKSRTGDFQTTTRLNQLIKNNANLDDIFAFLSDHNIPADEVSLYNMAKEILNKPPKIGYLTISNALQWRLQYGRICNLSDSIKGITPIL